MPSAEVQNMIPEIQHFLASQPVEYAYLFGSCSRGEETANSDIDLLVRYTNPDQLSLLDISRMMVQLRMDNGENGQNGHLLFVRLTV